MTERHKKNLPPGMLGVSFGVENKLVHGVFYYAAGNAPCPTVVLCHGFPGFEKNGDLAHALRREGFNVLLFSYRGSWGSQGDFAFSHVIVDTCRAARYVAGDEFPMKDRVKRDSVILVGNSMGGFAALMAASRSRDIKTVVSIAGWNVGRCARGARTNPEMKARVDGIISGAMVLQGTSSAALWNEMSHSEDDYDLCSIADALSGKKILLIAATRDTDAPPEENHVPLVNALGCEERWLDTDHSFSDSRLELAQTVIDWLKTQR